MAATGAGAVAAVARARRQVISHFLAKNAVSPEAAIMFETKRVVERKIFDRFVREKVILPTDKGKFYIDVPAWDAYANSRRRRIGMAMAALAAVGGAAMAILG